jgi:hypothetical protein
MKIHNFDLMGVTVAPHKTDPPLIIDADAVLTSTIAMEHFQPLAGRRTQVRQLDRGIEHVELPQGRALDIRPEPFDPPPPIQGFRQVVGKTRNQRPES